ncbi:MAG: AAA family ATPase, partial [Bacilli bacterium]|nr:AAA family ATPase [Bacilli bacterium]
IIDNQIDVAKEKLNQQANTIIGYTEGLRGSQFTRQAMMNFYANQIYTLESIRNNPYFGSFIFQQSSKEPNEIYIGKKMISDNNGKIITHDWRSPICSLYYDYEIGPASYESEGKKISGDILDKKQIVIKNGELIDVKKKDVISNDNILIEYLNKSNNDRIKNIISTIQKEQNMVIRNSLDSNNIIQGSAGSGKTTVALHRISYLLYAEAKRTNSSQFLILGPNKYFINYISSMLPELEIANINQSTFEDISKKIIKWRGKYKDKTVILKEILNKQTNMNAIHDKNSIEFIKLLENFIDLYVQRNLERDITYEEVLLCDANNMSFITEKNRFVKDKVYGKKIAEFQKGLIKKIKENSVDLCHQVWINNKDRILSIEKGSALRNQELDKLNLINEQIRKGCSAIIKDYFKFTRVKAVDLYRTFIESLGSEFDYIKEQTLSNLRLKTISDDDLAALTIIEYKLGNNSINEEIKHVIIDEAQDISPAQYYVLNKLFPNCIYDVFGDLNQSIYSYQSLENWDQLNKLLFNNEAKQFYLDKTYRTTYEISNVANHLLNDINGNISNCVARSGGEVEFNISNKKNIWLEIACQIKKLDRKVYKSVAVICKDDDEVNMLRKNLSKLNINIDLISKAEPINSEGIYILPSYYAKGMEFDAVIVSDASYNRYQNNDVDLKLLYVSVTRAIHKLIINSSDQLNYSLEKFVNSDSKKKILKI